jgi:hypothetical protein
MHDMRMNGSVLAVEHLDRPVRFRIYLRRPRMVE